MKQIVEPISLGDLMDVEPSDIVLRGNSMFSF